MEVKKEETRTNDRINEISSEGLERLLQWDGNLRLEDKVILPHFTKVLGIPVKIRSFSSDEQKYIEDTCVDVTIRNGQRIREPNYLKMVQKYLWLCIVDPNLKDTRLQVKFNSGRNEEQIISKLFLPGEQQTLGAAILRLSGHSDEDVKDLMVGLGGGLDEKLENFTEKNSKPIKNT